MMILPVHPVEHPNDVSKRFPREVLLEEKSKSKSLGLENNHHHNNTRWIY